jgi:GNAT superfamily N-acetyltransferase
MPSGFQGQQLQPVEPSTVRRFLARYHYLGVKGVRIGRSFGMGNEELHGVLVFHGISAPETAVGAFGLGRTEQGGLWELGRLALAPDFNGGNYGSWFVGRCIRELRKTEKVRAIISYAEAPRHNGAIYQACNFQYCGISAAKADYVVNGRIQERGKTWREWFGEIQPLNGIWQDRPRKHRYVLLFDKSLSLKWPIQPYPKREM